MKTVVGMVVSNKMQKSVVVAVDRLFHHKLYNRYVKRTSKPLSKRKHCVVAEILTKPPVPSDSSSASTQSNS
ncbi:unnamed protein product [Malus baccata var. baccata]